MRSDLPHFTVTCISKSKRFRIYFLWSFRFFKKNSHYGILFANFFSLHVRMMTRRGMQDKAVMGCSVQRSGKEHCVKWQFTDNKQGLKFQEMVIFVKIAVKTSYLTFLAGLKTIFGNTSQRPYGNIIIIIIIIIYNKDNDYKGGPWVISNRGYSLYLKYYVLHHCFQMQCIDTLFITGRIVTYSCMLSEEMMQSMSVRDCLIFMGTGNWRHIYKIGSIYLGRILMLSS